MDVPSDAKLSACDVNPFDSVMYCTVNSYLARFDRRNLRYVAKLATGSTAATFDEDGNFYYEGQGYSGLYKVAGLDKLEDYENQDDGDVTDFSDDDPIADSISGAQDLVYFKSNLEGDGEKRYLP